MATPPLEKAKERQRAAISPSPSPPKPKTTPISPSSRKGVSPKPSSTSRTSSQPKPALQKPTPNPPTPQDPHHAYYYDAPTRTWKPRQELVGAMNEILPGLYLGSRHAAATPELLRERNITAVLCVEQDSSWNYVRRRVSADNFWHVCAKDNLEADLLDQFPYVCGVIERHLEKRERAVSRTPSPATPTSTEGEEAKQAKEEKAEGETETETKEAHADAKTGATDTGACGNCDPDTGALLIHCRKGISRSATLVLAYLLAQFPNRSINSVLREVWGKRPIIKPNHAFLVQLFIWKRCNFKLWPPGVEQVPRNAHPLYKRWERIRVFIPHNRMVEDFVRDTGRRIWRGQDDPLRGFGTGRDLEDKIRQFEERVTGGDRRRRQDGKRRRMSNDAREKKINTREQKMKRQEIKVPPREKLEGYAGRTAKVEDRPRLEKPDRDEHREPKPQECDEKVVECGGTQAEQNIANTEGITEKLDAAAVPETGGVEGGTEKPAVPGGQTNLDVGESAEKLDTVADEGGEGDINPTKGPHPVEPASKADEVDTPPPVETKIDTIAPLKCDKVEQEERVDQVEQIEQVEQVEQGERVEQVKQVEQVQRVERVERQRTKPKQVDGAKLERKTSKPQHKEKGPSSEAKRSGLGKQIQKLGKKLDSFAKLQLQEKRADKVRVRVARPRA